MLRLALVFAVILLFPGFSDGSYKNLIAASDSTVYVEVQWAFGESKWYSVSSSAGQTEVTPLEMPVADVRGASTATSSYASRYCAFAGSTCFLRPSCQATTRIRGASFDVTLPGQHAFIRFDPRGSFAWMETMNACPGPFGSTGQATFLSGIYQPAALAQIAPAGGARLASQRHGAITVTLDGRALTFSGPQLQWLDRRGAQSIPHTSGAYEAVTDAAGLDVVYVEAPSGRLHWMSVADDFDWSRAHDQDLDLVGSSPVFSNGRLAFLDEDRRLRLYDRRTGVIETVTGETYRDFALPFAITSDGGVVRIDLVSGEAKTLLAPFPEISDISAPPFFVCQLVCYFSVPPKSVSLGRTMIVAVKGNNLNQPGWRVRTSGSLTAFDVPLIAESPESAWFQVPATAPLYGGQSLELYNPEHPIRLPGTVSVLLSQQVIACRQTLHQDYSRAVTPEDPASPGEIVHVIVTGLAGTEPVADLTPNPTDRVIDVANPPSLSDAGAAEIVSSRFIPGEIGLQQIDLRIIRPFEKTLPLFSIGGFGCTPPAVLAQ